MVKLLAAASPVSIPLLTRPVHLNGPTSLSESKAEMRAESRAATEARLAALKARLTTDAARILKPGVAKVLMPIVLSAIEAAIRAKMWAKESE